MMILLSIILLIVAAWIMHLGIINAINNLADSTKNSINALASDLRHYHESSSTTNDRVVDVYHPPHSVGNVETKQAVEVGVRANASNGIEEAGIATLVSRSVKSAVSFGQEE